MCPTASDRAALPLSASPPPQGRKCDLAMWRRGRRQENSAFCAERLGISRAFWKWIAARPQERLQALKTRAYVWYFRDKYFCRTALWWMSHLLKILVTQTRMLCHASFLKCLLWLRHLFIMTPCEGELQNKELSALFLSNIPFRLCAR